MFVNVLYHALVTEHIIKEVEASKVDEKCDTTDLLEGGKLINYIYGR